MMISPVQNLRSISPGVEAVAVIGPEGEVEEVSCDHDDVEGLVGPLATPLATLASRAARELGRGTASTVFIDASQGRVVARELGDGRLLVAVAGPGARLGLLLDDVSACAAAVSRGGEHG